MESAPTKRSLVRALVLRLAADGCNAQIIVAAQRALRAPRSHPWLAGVHAPQRSISLSELHSQPRQHWRSGRETRVFCKRGERVGPKSPAIPVRERGCALLPNWGSKNLSNIVTIMHHREEGCAVAPGSTGFVGELGVEHRASPRAKAGREPRSRHGACAQVAVPVVRRATEAARLALGKTRPRAGRWRVSASRGSHARGSSGAIDRISASAGGALGTRGWSVASRLPRADHSPAGHAKSAIAPVVLALSRTPTARTLGWTDGAKAGGARIGFGTVRTSCVRVVRSRETRGVPARIPSHSRAAARRCTI